MNRKTLDSIASYLGLGIAVLLVVAGALLNWGYSFASGTVKEQLAEQNIAFHGLTAEANPKIFQWNDMQVTDGEMAYGYANYYIAEHMQGAIAGFTAQYPAVKVGTTYSEASGAFMTVSKDPAADPAMVAALGGLRQTLFMGDTLRGLLMTTYAFWTFGQIAMYAAWACWIGAALFLLLALLGFRHAKNAAGATV